jgi:hypothetical protein
MMKMAERPIRPSSELKVCMARLLFSDRAKGGMPRRHQFARCIAPDKDGRQELDVLSSERCGGNVRAAARPQLKYEAIR